VKKKGKTLAELLIDVRITRKRIRNIIDRVRNRIDVYNEATIRNLSSFPHLSKMLARESEFLENVINNLYTLEVLLEMLEIKMETLIYIGYIVNSAPAVIEAIKMLKDNFSMIPEITLMLDEIYEGFYFNIKIPKEIKISSREEAKNILIEAENIAKKREKSEIYYQLNT